MASRLTTCAGRIAARQRSAFQTRRARQSRAHAESPWRFSHSSDRDRSRARTASSRVIIEPTRRTIQATYRGSGGHPARRLCGRAAIRAQAVRALAPPWCQPMAFSRSNAENAFQVSPHSPAGRDESLGYPSECVARSLKAQALRDYQLSLDQVQVSATVCERRPAWHVRCLVPCLDDERCRCRDADEPWTRRHRTAAKWRAYAARPR